jgi:Flp pilus assembly protein TadG
LYYLVKINAVREQFIWNCNLSYFLGVATGVLDMLKAKNIGLDSNGNVAVFFAIAAVPMLVAAGVAIDMVRTNVAKSVVQSAADAAALAGAASFELSKADLEAVVKKYLVANGTADVLASVTDIDIKRDTSKNTLSVSIVGKHKTTLLHLAGIDETDIGAYSEVKLPGDGLEVALVLDNTASMNAAGRLPALKDASKNLVADLMHEADSGAYVRVGIVPFSNYVNVGISRRSEPWLDVADDKTTYGCWDTYPSATKSNCRQLPSIVDGIDTGSTYEQCDWDYGTPVKACGNQTYTWMGCVGSRVEPLDESIGSISSRYKGLPNQSCTSEIVALTDDKAKLDATIDGFVAIGETYVPAGLLWGWNMLDSNKPLSEAKSEGSMKAKGGTKAIVLMTDGQNTLAAFTPYHYGGGATEWARGDAKTTAVCDKIKADGVVIYTVSFMITDVNAKSLMTSCASDASKAFSADDPAELSKAFADVGQSLMSMRLNR